MMKPALRPQDVRIASVAALCSLAVIGVALADEPDTRIFGNRVYEAGTAPEAIKAVDLDGDGALDLIVTNEETITVRRGDGRGRFAPWQTLVGGGASIALADITANGELDLVVGAREGCAIALYEGVGGGLFADAIAIATGCGPMSVVAADFDGDGFIDIASANVISQSITVLMNQGGGAFDSFSFNAAVNEGAGVLAFGDMDGGDGPDLVVAGGDSVVVHFNDGAGGFPTSDSFDAGSSPGSLDLGDLTGDGRLDVAVTNRLMNRVTILKQIVPGALEGPGVLPVGSRPERVRMIDVDGEGALDLVVAHPSTTFDTSGSAEGAVGLRGGEIRVFRNDGRGNFTQSDRFFAGARPRDFAAGDFDGDGLVDLATVSRFMTLAASPFLKGEPGGGQSEGDFNGYVTVSHGLGEGRFAAALRALSAGASRIRLADIDSDGRPDLIESRNFGLLFRRNTDDGAFSEMLGGVSLAGLPQNDQSFFPGRIDSDPHTDIVIATNGGLVVISGNGTGQFSPPNGIAPGDFRAVTGGRISSGGVGFDLVAARQTQDGAEAVILINDGDGQFTLADTAPIGEAPFDAVIADFTGDGVADAAIASRIGASVTVLTLDSTGTILHSQELPLPGEAVRIVSCDFDGDGAMDLIAAVVGGPLHPGGAVLLHNDGAGSFTVGEQLGAFAVTREVAAHDLTYNGLCDLLVADSDQDRIALYLNHGDGFAFDGFIGAGVFPRSIVLEDVDGDDRPDMIVSNHITTSTGNPVSVTASVMTYTNRLIGPATAGDLTGNGVVGGSDLAVLLQMWGPCADDDCPADFNGDGVVDGRDLAVLLANWTG